MSPDKYYAPAVIDHLSNTNILCAEFVDGVEIDTLVNESQELRDRIGTLMLELTLRELFEFKVMQTDPNPANYLYNKEHDRMNLLDFGASREFSSFFLENYAEIIHGAYTDDKEKIMEHSHTLKFLTGEENREMLTAHHAGVLVLGEPFRKEGLYDFGALGFIQKVRHLLPTLSKHRLTPPPEEVYSLNKKIVGTYMTCIKLRSRVPAQRLFEEAYQRY